MHSLGVKQGQTVLVWLPNGYQCLRAWFGINMIGAVYVPINMAYRGGILQHVVSNAGASVAIVHASLLQRLSDIDKRDLRTVIVIDGEPTPIAGLDMLPASASIQLPKTRPLSSVRSHHGTPSRSSTRPAQPAPRKEYYPHTPICTPWPAAFRRTGMAYPISMPPILSW